MAALNKFFEAGGQLNRVMVYGPSQSRKTWWCGLLAEAGYNVLFCDSDGNPGVLRQLTPAAQARIYYLNIQDTLNAAVATEFWSLLLQHQHLWYHEADHRVMLAEHGQAIHVDIRNWDGNFAIVCDSWTSLSHSVLFEYSIQHKIDLADAAKTDWPGYGWAGRKLSWMLKQISQLPCHFFCVGHATMYEKKKNVTDAYGKVTQVPEWTRRQPVSISYPHGMQVGRTFGETYYMYQHKASANIEPFGDQMADGGSRFLPRETLDWKSYPPSALMKRTGHPPPPSDLPFIEFAQSQKRTAAEAIAAKRAKPPVLAAKPVPINSNPATQGVKS